MELLLNLCWLTFALLAVGLWWRARSQERCNRLPQLVVLSCVPILPEMEESNPSKKIKAAAQASSNSSGVFDSLPAPVDCHFLFSPHSKIWGQVSAELVPVPETAQLCKDACRAPPAPALS